MVTVTVVVLSYPNGDSGDSDVGVAVTAAAAAEAAALSSTSSVSVASSLNPLCKAKLEGIIFSILTSRGANLYATHCSVSIFLSFQYNHA